MANELKALVAASSTGNYALVVNPSNNAQAWDVTAGAWAAYDRTDSDQQIALGSAIAAGAGDEWQFANLPTGLNADAVYEYHVFDSDDELLGPRVYQPALSLQEGIATESEPGAIEAAIVDLDVEPTDPDQEEAGPNRTAIIVQTDGGVLQARAGFELSSNSADENLMHAADFRSDLGKGQRIASVVSVLVYDSNGAASVGITIADTKYRLGPLAKWKMTGVTAGTYTLKVKVTYSGSTGTRTATIPVEVL